MKRIIIALITIAFAITVLSADPINTDSTPACRGQICGYVYKSYYPNNSTVPKWRPMNGESVKISIIGNNNTTIRYYTTSSDGFYSTPSYECYSNSEYHTVQVECHGRIVTRNLENDVRIDFYIDQEY
ncbi:MAG: hypothetical protein WC218_08830 [Candidatus Cloacimonadales bacterium]